MRFANDEWSDAVTVLKENNFRWVREEMNWDTIEPEDNVFDFSHYDDVIDLYKENNVKVLGLLTYSSGWASNGESEFDPPNIDEWKEYVATVAERYKGRVNHWEIWNEPNNSNFWTGERDEYATLLIQTYNQIKKVNPDATVVSGGTAGVDTDFLYELCENLDGSDALDAVAIHPYRELNGTFNRTPEESTDGLNSLLTDLQSAQRTVEECWGPDTAIWLTEFGWPTTETGATGVSLKKQRNYLMRQATQALTIPQVSKVFIYELRDSGTDASDHEDHFGVLNRSFKAKEALQPLAQLNTQLHGATVHSTHTTPNPLENITIQADDWSIGAEENATGSITATGADTTVTEVTIHYDFTSLDNSYVEAIAPVPENTNNYSMLALNAKAADGPEILRLRVEDATGEVHQFTLGAIPTEWTPLFVRLQTDYRSYWNGDGDGVIDYPIQAISFIADDVDRFTQVSGSISLKNVQFAPSPKYYGYRFQKNGRPMFIVWKTKTKQTLFRSVRAGVHRIIRIQSDERKKLKKKSRLSIGPAPLIILVPILVPK